jgi:Flp pilus assembly protein TadG
MKNMVSRRFNKRSEKGAAALEFAIIVPVLLLLVLGLMDIGRLLLVNMSLLSAAQQGARVSAMNSSVADSTLISTIRAGMPDAITRLSVLGNCVATVTSTCVSGSASTKCAGTNTGTTTVSATVTFYWLTPLELIWRFSSTTRGTFNDVTQSVTAQCLV